MKKLLVVVDMQNDFIDGSLGSPEAQSIVENVKARIESYMQAGDDVVFTLDTHEADYLDTLEGKNLPVVHCVKGTPGWEINALLKDYPGKRFEKNTFGSVECAHYVAVTGYDEIELIGLCTDICVISNALLMKATVPATPIKVNSSCCAGVTPESHRNALEAMKMCQIQITG